jgi:hypothetical protein
MVGHLHPVARDRRGNGQTTSARHRLSVPGQIVPDGVEQGGLLGAQVGGHVGGRCIRPVLPGETCVGAADVTEQAGEGGLGGKWRMGMAFESL